MIYKLDSFHIYRGVSKTQRKWFYDENRDGLDDEIRGN